MAKAAKIPPANGDTSSPKKGAGGSTQKYKPSPQKTSLKKEGKKPKIVNLKNPDGTCYDLDECFSVVPPRDAAADDNFDAAIRAADSDLEDLI